MLLIVARSLKLVCLCLPLLTDLWVGVAIADVLSWAVVRARDYPALGGLSACHAMHHLNMETEYKCIRAVSLVVVYNY
jgi:hypothetical protein